MICVRIAHMSRKGKPNKIQMPVELKRKVYISLRLRESEKALINKVFKDNDQLREFILEYCRSHE